MSVDWSTTKIRHGTQSGWKLHQNLGERPCDACYRAKQTYDQRRRAAPEQTRMSRLRAAAQNAAYRRLAAIYPDLYAALYDEECAARLDGEQP